MVRRIIYFALKLANKCCLLFLVLCCTMVFAQAQQTDTSQVAFLLRSANEYRQQNRLTEAQSEATKALQLAEKLNFIEGRGNASILLGQIYFQTDNHTLALKNLLQAENIFKSLNKPTKQAEANQLMGDVYYQKGDFIQALRYYETTLRLNPKIESVKIVQKKAYIFEQLGENNQAIQQYETLLTHYKNTKQPKETAYTQQKLALLTQKEGQYQKASIYTNGYLDNKSVAKNEEVAGYNNLGFLYKRQGKEKEALEAFNKALAIAKEQEIIAEGEEKATLYINTGVAYTNLLQFQKARYYYNSALKIRAKDKQPILEADTYNYLAANYYVSGNLTNALNNVNKAISLAEPYPKQNQEVLQVSYQLLHLIHTQNGNLIKAKAAQEKSESLAENLKKQQIEQEKAILEQQKQIEEEENSLKNLLVLEEKQMLETRRLAIEKERQEKEIALLKKDKQLQEARLVNQQLERQRIEQLLAITQQKAKIEKKQAELDKQRQANQLLVKDNELKATEAQRQKQQIQLQNQQIELQTLKAEKQERQKKYFLIGILVTALVLAVVALALVINRKKNKLLNKSNEEIKIKNEELQQLTSQLQQQQEEVLAQRDFIEIQNRELVGKNEQMNQSVNAAQVIQNAILPFDHRLDSYLKDYFIIYQPRDVVSGDFYWAEEEDNITILVAVDCTGHGIPGAFMSMIGNTLLDNIIKVSKITRPSLILSTLNERIASALKNDDAQNMNGMDVCVVALEKLPQEQIKVTFAGAKRPLYYIQNNQNAQVIKPDRFTIGGMEVAGKKFEDKELLLQPNDCIYLSSDGLIDQNDVNRKKFGEKRLLALLSEISHLNMLEQKKLIEKKLNRHQRGTIQRDDILFWGVRL